MARFWTSDLHLGHANIVRFCERPFARDANGTIEPDVEAMNRGLCAGINSVVGPSDELWVLGDVAMGKIDETLGLRSALRAGQVFLVPGNHDRCHPMHKKHEMWRRAYEEAGWVVTDPVLDVNLGREQVRVSHFPYPGPFEDHRDRGDRFASWRPEDSGGWLLCGHVHEAWRQRDRMINVGVDAWGGLPVSDDVLVGMIMGGSAASGPISWGSGA